MSGALVVDAPFDGDPAAELAGDSPAGFAPEPPADAPVTEQPDPVAAFPAGLDPRTLRRIDGTSEPPPTLEPVRTAITLGAAQLGYDHHPARVGGGELSARLEVWRALAWSAHLAYFVDTIDARTPAGATATAFHDLAIGGRAALQLGLPAWVIADVHVLDGGNAIYGALGVGLAGFDLELGGSAMQLGRDMGVAASLRVARGASLRGWLGLDGGATTIGGMPLAHLGGGAGLALHRTHWSLDVSALVGDRSLAVTDGGELAGSIADTFHTSGRSVVRLQLGAHLAPYAGIAARTATTPDHTDYAQLVGFAGLSFTL